MIRTRIYRVTYSELNPSENVKLLNNGINLFLPLDYPCVQSLIPIHRYYNSFKKYGFKKFFSTAYDPLVTSPMTLLSFVRVTIYSKLINLANVSKHYINLHYILSSLIFPTIFRPFGLFSTISCFCFLYSKLPSYDLDRPVPVISRNFLKLSKNTLASSFILVS